MLGLFDIGFMNNSSIDRYGNQQRKTASQNSKKDAV
jgi:hypothetical protein